MGSDDPEGYADYSGVVLVDHSVMTLRVPPRISYAGEFTKREYAAILLRVPNSGEDWLDDMIRKSHQFKEQG